MHPNSFLKTFWRGELRPQVFVAMSFDPKYQSRFDEVIKPAVQAIRINDAPLEPYRVDLSKSGDSILTDIVDGIAHSQLILADVSTIGKDSVTGLPYRNANVMYEVGIALACRQSSEVLLVRDDHDKFLFDVSTVPHMTMNFTDAIAAKALIAEGISQRIAERKMIDDARVERITAGLTLEELNFINKNWKKFDTTSVFGFTHENLFTHLTTSKLLEKQVLKVIGQFDTGSPACQFTKIGAAVALRVSTKLQQYILRESPEPSKPTEPPIESRS
jgi:hypothetical protein